MKRFLSILTMILMVMPFVNGKSNEPLIPEYTIQGVGANGTSKTVVVTILTKKPDKLDFDTFKRAAVHGVLFKGYMKQKGQMGGGSHTPALMKKASAEQQHADFFESFFKNKEYNSYVDCIGSSRRVVKVGKEHQVSCSITYDEKALREAMQEAGVLKNMSKSDV